MLLFEITARDTCGPHGGHSVDRASSLLSEITRLVLQTRGLTTSFALQPLYPEEYCPQSTSRWQLNSYRLPLSKIVNSQLHVADEVERGICHAPPRE